MGKTHRETIKEHLYWAYANLAMEHTAVERQQKTYGQFNFMIRAKLFKGLMTNSMNIRTIFDDEKIKLTIGTKCNYCNSTEKLALDHILSQKFGGKDEGDNLIFACRTCNSSKGKKDLMEWMVCRDEFLPLMIIRRYLKLTISFCIDHNLMDTKLSEIDLVTIPFNINSIPLDYPTPDKLRLL